MPGRETSQPMFNGPAKAATTVILAHGAGAGMDTPFLEFFMESINQGLK